jgi:hypothetical protein
VVAWDLVLHITVMKAEALVVCKTMKKEWSNSMFHKIIAEVVNLYYIETWERMVFPRSASKMSTTWHYDIFFLVASLITVRQFTTFQLGQERWSTGGLPCSSPTTKMNLLFSVKLWTTEKQIWSREGGGYMSDIHLWCICWHKLLQYWLLWRGRHIWFNYC